ncbi:DUF5808 domain-containing protein [Nocardioides sp.]|uniref:DUF5808 domain-containing protein n=1 Tax=Nocardioides sp. TaxID=35761 RepID=UPI002ED2EB3F
MAISKTHPATSDKPARRRARDGLALVALALAAVAVVKELRTPPGERSWHGVLFGFIPYDLRVPTLARLRRSLWSPDDERLLLPRSFGVGWSPNLARVVALCRRVLGRRQ